MKSILIIGMGRFGSYTARRLYEQGHEVMGVDLQADHPAAKNALAKRRLFEKTAERYENETNREHVQALREVLASAFSEEGQEE